MFVSIFVSSVTQNYSSLFTCSFLRSVAYREFSRLIYDFLGNKRIPLPACAYTEIRRAFPCAKDEEYSGFDIDDEDK